MSESLHVIPPGKTPTGKRCRFLFSKGMAVNAGLPEDEHVVGDGHFWCGRNQRVYGPDEQLCGGEYCTEPSRSCYEAP